MRVDIHGLRLVLLFLMVLSVHGIFIVEQPRGSILFEYYRWPWLQEVVAFVTQIAFNKRNEYMHMSDDWPAGSACMIVSRMCQVHMASWWMMAYGAPSPKRLQARSNWPLIANLDTGKLAKSEMQRKTKVKTTRQGLITHTLMESNVHVYMSRSDWQNLVWNVSFEEHTVPSMCI